MTDNKNLQSLDRTRGSLGKADAEKPTPKGDPAKEGRIAAGWKGGDPAEQGRIAARDR